MKTVSNDQSGIRFPGKHFEYTRRRRRSRKTPGYMSKHSHRFIISSFFESIAFKAIKFINDDTVRYFRSQTVGVF